MRSIADRQRDEERREVGTLSATERVALALALGERDLAIFRAAHEPSLERAEATAILERRRQAGRRPSRCLDALID